MSVQRIIKKELCQPQTEFWGMVIYKDNFDPYTVSLASPSHSLELRGLGLVQVLSLVALHWALQVDKEDQAVHPPIRTQLGFLAGTVQAGTQSSNSSPLPAQFAPPLAGAGSLQ